MTTAAFCAFICLPVLIDAPGQYITRGGDVVTITHTSVRHDFRCCGTYSNGIAEGWNKTGRLYFGVESINDIVRRA